MGIRSDVALAAKFEVVEKVNDYLVSKGFKTLQEDCEKFLEEKNSFIFVWYDIKWHSEHYPELEALYEALELVNSADYLLIVATPEYPSETGDDRGEWHNNPWYLHKYVTCTVEFSNPL
jgi:hypothetical protein